MSGRIRWQEVPNGSLWGYVGTLHPAAFQIAPPRSPGGEWSLGADLPGMEGMDCQRDDPDALKAEAERRLEEFVSSLGASFPAGPVISRCECGGLANHRHGCRWRQGYGSLIEAVTDEMAKEAGR